MKSLLSSIKFYNLFLWAWMVFLCLSCQDDLVEDGIDQGIDSGVTNTQLINLMGNVALNDGSHDNVIDNANCLEIVLPVSVIIGDTTYAIDQPTDYNAIRAILNENQNDTVSMVFPLSVIHINHEVEVVSSQEDFDILKQACLGEDVADQDIECVDFQYPLGFSTFNPEFQIVSTATVIDDRSMVEFVSTINTDLVVDVIYPISVVRHDGVMLEMTEDEQLVEMLMESVSSCDEDDNYNYNDLCNLNEVDTYLGNCYWEINSYNGEDALNHYIFEFSTNNDLFIYDYGVVIDGQWSSSETPSGLVVSFSSIEVIGSEIEGDWLISQCSSGEMILMRGDDIMVLRNNCFEGPLYCMNNYIYEACDNGTDGEAYVNLDIFIFDCDLTQVAASYHTSQADAQSGINPIATPESYTATGGSETVWARIYLISDPDQFTLYFIEINVVNCCDNPQDLIDDLVVYMPLSEFPIELISHYIATASNNFTEDRDGSAFCAMDFAYNSFNIPTTATNQIVQGDAFSISIWFRMLNQIGGDLEYMFQKGTSAGEGFQLGVYDLNTPLFTAGNFSIWDEDWNNEVDVDWTNTDWHHLVITVDESNTVKLYRDGILRNEIINSDLNIGGTLDTYSLGDNFRGNLDDLRVYKSTLNPTEIQQLYNLEGDCYTCL